MKHCNHQEAGRKLEKYQFWFMVLRFLWTSPLFLWNSEQFSGFPQELECGGVRYFFLFLISATRSLLYINSAIVSASVCKQITLHLFNRLALLGEWMKHGWFTRQGNMLFRIYWCNTTQCDGISRSMTPAALNRWSHKPHSLNLLCEVMPLYVFVFQKGAIIPSDVSGGSLYM